MIEKDPWTSDKASPCRPSLAASAVMIEVRVRSGRKAATTITNGKKATNAFPASATLRSTNSTSSKRSQIRHSSILSSHVRRAGPRPCGSATPV